MYVIDVEADALINPTRIWCIVIKNIDSGEVHVFDGDDLKERFISFAGTVDCFIGHNLIGWDRSTIRDLLGYDIRYHKVIDTLVLSRLLKYNLDDGHSLEAWGTRLNLPKGSHTDFTVYSREMLDYCKQDVELTHKVYNYLMRKLDRPEFKQAIEVEHEMAWICQGMHEDGFNFDYEEAKKLYDELTVRLADLDNELLTAFPPKAVFIREITPKLTRHGTISRSNLPRDWTDYTELAADCPFSLIKWEPFSASSVKQCVDRLWDAGWSPTDKTKGHLECENTKEKERLEHFQRYGWKLNETNIATLPDYDNLEKLLNNQWIKLSITDTTTTKILRKVAKETETSTIKINSIGEITILKRIMESTVQSMIDSLLCRKADVESAVEQMFNLWSIIATPTGMYVDCSATGAMETWVGSSCIEKAQKRISKLKAAHRLVERLLLAGRHRTLEEWFRHCHMQIEIPVTSINENIKQKIEKNGKNTTETITMSGINKIIDVENPILKQNMGSQLKTLIVWLKSKGVNVKSVQEKKSSVLITVIPVEKLGASSVSSVMVTLDGLKTIGIEYNVTSSSIHSFINHIGTWTGRMSHTSPNLGNIATAKSIKYRSDHLQSEAVALGVRMRSLWTCDKEDTDSFLVGTDAVGIQLRIFAHYINDPIFTEALINGSSKQGTDAHTLNANLLGCSRDTAKTFIYAFLLGAGDSKLAEILQTTVKSGRGAKRRFIEAYPGLSYLRDEVVPRDANRGYFQTFDGRFIVCDSEHLMMAGYLQAGEMCITKHACVRWRELAKQEKIKFTQVNFVHDEYQTVCHDGKEAAHKLGQLQVQAIREMTDKFKLNCPMDGEYRIGKSWYDTH